ncbi:MAG: hypothetical protein IKT87_05200, partial [Bacteroidaceae bacterium]|nr:hypothetical protein [Bacteroidaceae bacterium]
CCLPVANASSAILIKSAISYDFINRLFVITHRHNGSHFSPPATYGKATAKVRFFIDIAADMRKKMTFVTSNVHQKACVGVGVLLKIE